MSDKNLDRKGRWRTKIISFRVSPEENKYLNDLVSLSGLTKQDYIIDRILEKPLVVYGNPRVFKRIKRLVEYSGVAEPPIPAIGATPIPVVRAT